MKKLTFYGIDASIETSLIEYGIIVSNEYHEDGSGTQFCVYKISENSYGCGHFKECEIDAILTGNDWASNESLAGFYSFLGIAKIFGQSNEKILEYLESPLCYKMSDLISYYGVENICGTDYSPMTEEEVKEIYLN